MLLWFDLKDLGQAAAKPKHNEEGRNNFSHDGHDDVIIRKLDDDDATLFPQGRGRD